jgi:hypothetical protein
MIPSSKGLIYSYRDFSAKDLEVFDDPLDFETDDIFKKDTVNFLDLEVSEFIDFIRKKFVQYSKDVNTDYIYHNKYFFKEFCVRFFEDSLRNKQSIYHYSLSGWDIMSKNKGIDDRTLTIAMYDFADSARLTYKFIVKTEHIYQLIKDLKDTSDYVYYELVLKEDKLTLANDQLVNLYVLPIYLMNNGEYERISDFAYGEIDCENLMYFLDDIRDALKVFAATNYYMLDMYNSNDKVAVYNKRTRRFSNMTFKAYSSTATNDKKLYCYLKEKNPNRYTPSVEIEIDTDRSNILAGTDIPRKLCEHRFSVRGHWSHRWIGKRGNQRLVPVWIDPYEKNKDKPFKIIKETRLK